MRPSSALPKPGSTGSNRAVLIHLHIAALLLGGTAQFSKLIEYAAIDIIAYRTLICGVIVLAIALGAKHALRPNSRIKLILLILCSALFCVHWTAYFQAMKVSSVAVGIVAMFSFPVMTVFIEPFFSKTRIQSFDIAMGLLVLIGVALMVPEFALSNQITVGVLFGLLSALAVAIRNVLVSHYLSNVSPFTVMAYHALISFMLLLPFTHISVQAIDLDNWLLLLLLGSLFTAIPHTQKTYGLMHTSAKTTSMIVSLQVVYATIIAYFLLGETVSWGTIAGGTCILGAAISESIRHSRT